MSNIELGQPLDFQKMGEDAKKPVEIEWASVEDANSEFSIPTKDGYKEVVKKHKEKSTKKVKENKNISSQLSKFREIFGLKRIDVVPYSLVRRSSDGNSNTEMIIGLRAMNYDDFQWCLERSANIVTRTEEDTENSFNIKKTFAYHQVMVAISICSLDGSPIWKVFGLEDDSIDSNYPKFGTRCQSAELVLQELKTTLYDAVIELHAAIESLVGSYEAKFKEEQKSPLV